MSSPVHVYAVDLNPMGGEGVLGSTFLRMLGRKYLIHRCWFRENQYNQDAKQNLFTKYALPILYALEIRLLSFFFRKRVYCYINYLPLWNTLLYLILPRNTILGPITGGRTDEKYYRQQKTQKLVRHYIFPFLYKMSSFLIERKFPKALLGTDYLSRYFSQTYTVFSNFCFCATPVDFDSTQFEPATRDIDFLFYLRNHPSKYYIETVDLIDQLRTKYKIIVVGDVDDRIRDISLGYQSRSSVLSLMKRSRITVSLSTNFYSLFFIESIALKVPSIIFDPDGNSKFDSISIQRIGVMDFDRIYDSVSSVEDIAMQIEDTKKHIKLYFL